MSAWHFWMIPDWRFSLPSTPSFATTLPHAGALASNNLEPKDLFFDETFDNLPFLRLGSHRRAFDVHLRQCLLGIGGYHEFDAPRRRFLGWTELPASAQDRHHEARRRWRGPMRQELCFLSRRSSFLLSSLQRWAEAASFLHGNRVATRHISRFSFARRRRLRRRDEARDGPDAATARPVYPRS